MMSNVLRRRILISAAYLVHLYTASGIVFILLAFLELFKNSPQSKTIFFWLICALLIDATDGPLARRLDVKRWAGKISGRTIDDIVDYLGFCFVPLILIWRMDWLPYAKEYSWIFIVPPLIASLLGFANLEAKLEEDGLFSGFPSYWNIFAFYAGLWNHHSGPWPATIILLILAVLTLLPVRFIYPNRAPQPFKKLLLWGALAWLIIVLAMLPNYPFNSIGLVLLSLIYPLIYLCCTALLIQKLRQNKEIKTLSPPHN